MNCIIVIPVYKNFDLLNFYEKKSILQCINILSNYPICYAGPEQLDFEFYLKLGTSSNANLSHKAFDKCFFSGISGYNSLLLSAAFYQSFKNYDYMLIYQTDAWVFRDELTYWCNARFDFIGAPWFEGWTNPVSDKFTGAGNGGFSLRKLSSAKKVLKRLQKIKYIRRITNKYESKRISWFIRVLKIFNFYFKIKKWDVLYELLANDLNEDIFWGRFAGKVFSDYKVAPPEVAMKFSFETNPSLLFEKNNRELPFGCHAFEKHEPAFWKKHINA